MTADTRSAATGVVRAPSPFEGFRGRMDLIITPAFFLLLGFAVVIVWIYVDFDQQTASILRPSKLLRETWQHLQMTFWSTLIVILVAIPVGVMLTRPRFRKMTGPVLGVANAGQAVPAYGLLILFLAWLGPGLQTAVYALIVYSVLPILRNTMVGVDQVDEFVIEAGRGMGLSKWQALRRIEMPLAVPVILAGVRTALVINVGTAALGFLIGAGGLGVSIGAGLQLQRDTATFVAGALVAMLALMIDFTAALIERWLRPRGL